MNDGENFDSLAVDYGGFVEHGRFCGKLFWIEHIFLVFNYVGKYFDTITLSFGGGHCYFGVLKHNPRRTFPFVEQRGGGGGGRRGGKYLVY